MVATQQRVESLRAEALAKVFLTRTGELDVIPVAPSASGSGYDLLVRLVDDGASGSPIFAVEVKGTKKRVGSDRSAAKLDLNAASLRHLDMPLLLLLVDTVREDGYWGWLIEPVVDPGGNDELRLQEEWFPTFRGSASAHHGNLTKLDNEAVRRLTRQVLAWREARTEAAMVVLANGHRERQP